MTVGAFRFFGCSIFAKAPPFLDFASFDVSVLAPTGTLVVGASIGEVGSRRLSSEEPFSLNTRSKVGFKSSALLLCNVENLSK